MKLPNGLYAITPEHPQRDLTSLVEEALAGGARLIQYRDKSHDQDRRRASARALLDLCLHWDALLIINDDLELAADIGAHGIHLGRDDPEPLVARARLGADAIIGLSCYDRLDLALAAQVMGLDYVAFGRFFPSLTKPEAEPASLDLLRQARRQISLPLVAIGGITPENAPSVIEAGADLLAVVNGVFGAPDVRAAARTFTALYDRRASDTTWR